MSQAKEIIFDQEARKKLLSGIDAIADLVSITLGPSGLNIGLDNYGSCKITSESQAIIRELELKDDFSNMGIALARELADKIKEKCGDGTATGIVIFQKIVQNGIKNIASNSAPIELKRELDKALLFIMKELEMASISVKSDEEIKNVATVAASGDEEIGNTILEAFKKAKNDGVISVEEAKGVETQMELSEGLDFDRGYSSPYFCTNAEKMTCELNNARVLICDKKLSTVQEILPVLQQTAAGSEELLIIADDVEGELLSTLVVNKLKGILKVAVVKAPSFGDTRKAILEDIAILTSGQLLSEERGNTFKDAFSLLGSIDKAIITKDKTTIIGGKGRKEDIAKRIAQLEGEIAKAENSYDKERLSQRKAKLSGGVVILKVGAVTESELKQKKQVYEDAIICTRAALDEGVVSGGGLALFMAAQNLKKKSDSSELGAQIMIKACEAPLKQIIKNSGHEEGLLVEEIIKSGKKLGFNASSEKLEDFDKAKIFDPAKVVKNSLQLAVSMAGVVLLSEVLIANAKEE